jgi:CelD/BcsL family acetyltransferase involved in cellulose biosynthesis
MRALTSSTAAWALGPAWDDLLARSVSNVPFLTRDFLAAWWETLGEGEAQVLVAGAEPDRPLVIAPLALCPDGGVRPIGAAVAADYLDLIAAPADLELGWRLVVEWLAARDDWRTFEFPCLPDWSPSHEIVARLAAEAGWTVELVADAVCPAIALPSSWDDYLAGLRGKDRHELRRKISRLQRLADQERFTSVGPEDDLPTAIDDFLTLHRLSNPAKAGFWTARMERFFRRLLAAAHERGWLRLFFQEIDGARAAAVLAFRYGDRYYVYNSGHDPAYRELAAGVVCMARSLQTAIAEGVAVFDLLQGDERYKYAFGATDTRIYRCLARRPSA